MPEIKSEDRKKFEVVIDEEYINSVLSEYELDREDGEEITLTAGQWDELFYMLTDRFYPEIREAVSELLEEAELEKRNEGAEKVRPHYLIKYRHPNAFVKEWQDTAYTKTEKDAKSYIRYHCGHGIDEEWKVEKVE